MSAAADGTAQMRLLVVEDSPTQALFLRQRLLRAGFEVQLAANGREALAQVERQAPTLILTDLDMPELNGLELVREIRRRQLPVPVVLLTALGSEEIAVEALRAGAAAYIPKQRLDQELARVMDQVLAISRSSQNQRQLSRVLQSTRCRVEMPSDSSLAGALVRRVQQEMVRNWISDPTVLRQVGMAVHEALLNAIEHGNLEVPSALKEDGDRFRQLVEERSCQKPYSARRVRVTADHMVRDGQHELQYVIADEGPGFDPATLPDPTDLANLDRPSGRGLLLIRAFMDDVAFNAAGNEITMIKRMPG
jgi:CheY-like chemotaxis protein/anti-sigma regulatory factor (Ser/Thr protein kinase)